MTLTLKIVNQCFCMSHRLVIMHHHNKFGKKWLSVSGDTERTWSDTRTELQRDRWMDGQSDSNIPHRIQKSTCKILDNTSYKYIEGNLQNRVTSGRERNKETHRLDRERQRQRDLHFSFTCTFFPFTRTGSECLSTIPLFLWAFVQRAFVRWAFVRNPADWYLEI